MNPRIDVSTIGQQPYRLTLNDLALVNEYFVELRDEIRRLEDLARRREAEEKEVGGSFDQLDRLFFEQGPK